MEIIEKQVEKVKEVPCGYWENCGCGYGYNRYNSPFASKGVGGTALGLGIAGTALGLLALGKNGNGINLFGNSGYGTSGGSDANIAIASCGGVGGANGVTAPTAFQAWEKECEDALALTNAMWTLKVGTMDNARAAREVDVNEKFQLWKSQIDADFGLYKSTRDAFDVVNAKHNQDAFALYKSQRDADDDIRKELSDLKAQVAINAAIRPYQDKLIQCEIDKAFTAGINYTDRKTCKAIYGEVMLPNTPTVTGYVGANQCGCPRVVSGTTASA